jgi:PleD family two-component response regulator
MTAYFKQLKGNGGVTPSATGFTNVSQSSVIKKILLVGDDPKGIMKKRLQSVGAVVMRVASRSEVLDLARHQSFKIAVLLANSSLLNATEIAFNLHDLDASMKVFIVINSRWKSTHRWLRQLYDHPIAGTEIVTRRELQRQLRASAT